MVPRHPLATERHAAWLGMRPAVARTKLWMLAGVMRACMAGKGMLIRNDGPAVLGRKLLLPRRHRGASGAERLDQAPLADPPEPVALTHAGDHAGIAERRRLHRQAGRGRPVPGA